MKSTLLVTGASGHLGQTVLDTLLKNFPDHKVIATTRQPEKLQKHSSQGVELRQADFDDPQSLERAFLGADRLLLISTDKVGSRIEQHKNAVAAAKKAGVKHIVYTSLPEPETSVSAVAPEHAATEKFIRDSGMTYTILRNNLYADLLIGTLKTALAFGQVAAAAEKGRTAYITREDCAIAAAYALAAESNANSVADLTGPEAVSYQDLASFASELSGRNIPYIELSPTDFKAALEKSGLPAAWADLFVSFDLSIKQGTLKNVSSTFKSLTGKEPQNIYQFLKSHRNSILESN